MSSFDYKHKRLDSVLPFRQFYATLIPQFDYVECLVELVIFQKTYNQFLISFLSDIAIGLQSHTILQIK